MHQFIKIIHSIPNPEMKKIVQLELNKDKKNWASVKDIS